MNISLKKLARSWRSEFEVYRLVLQDPRTPRAAKFFLAAAVAYALSPIDLIPDFVPVLGYLDDLAIIPFLIFMGLRFVPKEVVEDCRHKAASRDRDACR